MVKEFDKLNTETTEKFKGKNNPQTNRAYTTEEILKLAANTWRENHGGKIPTHDESDKWFVSEDGTETLNDVTVHYHVPIITEAAKLTEMGIPQKELDSLEKEGKLPFKFMALYATTSWNMTKFLPEEIGSKKTVMSLRDRPILKDHVNEVDMLVGRTLNYSYYDKDEEKLFGTGWVSDEGVKEKITDKRLRNMSIGAHVDQMTRLTDDDGEDTGVMEAHGIEILEMSFTPVEGVTGAGIVNNSLEAAILESFDAFHAENFITSKQKKEEEVSMETKEELAKANEAIGALEKEKEELAREKLKYESELKGLKERVHNELLEKVLSARESAKMETSLSEKKEMESLTDEALKIVLKTVESLAEQEPEGEPEGDKPEPKPEDKPEDAKPDEGEAEGEGESEEPDKDAEPKGEEGESEPADEAEETRGKLVTKRTKEGLSFYRMPVQDSWGEFAAIRSVE